MQMFTRFNRKHIQDRQVDTLIGLGKGLVADGKIDQGEGEFLLSWLIQSRQSINNPIISNLLDKVSGMLEDGFLDKNESAELLKLLQSIAGESSEIGELAKPSTLPLCDPAPKVNFPGSYFLFTGTCAFGTRKQCQEVISALGGMNSKGVTQALNYLVIGSYVTDSWAHESFGRKIEKAMDYREKGISLSIITEEHWANEAEL